ncbi:hypothetical protein [Actinokineospora enzanensis]|uniref:WXG100-like domain-containing protein n=1 Tax=Actinokineospora enzanensis TaxID=155975 RepID=UPI00036A6017|nr:hypothetical protein [Actinokineospora enzanensis]
MTGLGVDGGILFDHAVGSTGQAGHFAGLASLLEQARVSDDCFGPLFVYFRDKYYETLRECQATARQAADYLTDISDAVRRTAESYGATESTNASGLAKVDGGAGTLDQLDHAGDDTRRGDFAQNSAYGSSFADAGLEDAAQVKDPGTPMEQGFALYHTRMAQLELITSPGKALVDNGLGWLIAMAVSPLVELILEPAVGDPEQMRSTASGWEKVAEWLERAGAREAERAAATATAWAGEAGDAFRAEMAEFADGAKALAGDVLELKDLLETAADIFDTFVQIVVDILQEFVLGLIVEWLAALAAAWITAGASAGAATGLTATQTALTGTRLGGKVAELLHKLKPLITQLEKALVKLRHGSMRSLLERSQKIGNLPVVGRKLTGGNPLLATAHSFEKKTLASTSGFKVFGKVADGAGELGLAQRVSKHALGYLGFGGSTSAGTVIATGTLENLPGAAVEWGANHMYEDAEDPTTEQDRRAAEHRGFTVGE